MSDAIVPLKFVITDPAPNRGKSEPASWQVNIESDNGTMWWSTSGHLPEGVEAGSPPLVDTITLQWNTPSAVNLSPGTTALTLTALATDGEGARGADFTQASMEGVALTSSGLWFLETSKFSTLHHLPNGSEDVFSYPLAFNVGSNLVHLDGQNLLLTGGTDLSAWAVSDGVPSASPSWTIAPPLVPQTGTIRFVRRAPIATTGPALAHVGWADRVQALNASGLVIQSWLLQGEESLIDATVMEDQMVCLVRTAALELRLIRFQMDSGARLGSITWTPQAQGSLGVTGLAWLVAIQGDPAALETDGTYRRWYQEPNGDTGIQSGTLSGSGEITAAGRLESGAFWFSRAQAHLVGQDLSAIATLDCPIAAVAEDRATARVWVLKDTGIGAPPTWQSLNAINWNTTQVVDPEFLGQWGLGTIAHNRPGPL